MTRSATRVDRSECRFFMADSAIFARACYSGSSTDLASGAKRQNWSSRHLLWRRKRFGRSGNGNATVVFKRPWFAMYSNDRVTLVNGGHALRKPKQTK
eukprot:738076-Rhodomonas_salina.1